MVENTLRAMREMERNIKIIEDSKKLNRDMKDVLLYMLLKSEDGMVDLEDKTYVINFDKL